MSTNTELLNFLRANDADESLITISSKFDSTLPRGVAFDSDQWNIAEWFKLQSNMRTRNIDFSDVRNFELKLAIKSYIIEKRILNSLEGASVKAILPALKLIDQILGPKPFKKINNGDFQDVEFLIHSNYNGTTPYRLSSYLEVFGQWLTLNFGLRITYVNGLDSNYFHGRKATDEEREEKLIHPQILADLVAANQRNDLIDKDKFYLAALTIFIGTGFRINELTTLPFDCIIEEEDRLGIRFYPEKKPKLDIRWIPEHWRAVVRDAYAKIMNFTDKGRMIAAKVTQTPGTDWHLVMQNPTATHYYVSKFCHAWTSDPHNHMLTPGRAWLQSREQYIDIVTVIKDQGSKSVASRFLGVSRHTVDYLLKSQQRADDGLLPLRAKGRSSEIRTDWDTDTRVISMLRLFQHTNIAKFSSDKECHDIALALIEDARDNYQLKGKIFPRPQYNLNLESHYKRLVKPLLKNEKGDALLMPEHALFVIPKYLLSDHRGTKSNDFTHIGHGISIWLCGVLRSIGTGNEEDSVFSRLNIKDPKTNKIAKFTSHDIRHWLTTYYLEGGMSSEEVALLFNRSESQNHVYDQTLSTTRLNSLRNSIKNGSALGHVAETYSNIASYSKEQAQSYLEACTLQINIMPHGGCSLNWGMESCENHNACFNSPDGVCKSLCLDLNDADTKKEVIQMHKEAESALNYIPPSSPQYSHYQNVKRNIESTGVINND